MNTEQFLRRILPAEGNKVLAELVTIPDRDKAGWRYSAYRSFEAMAEAALQLDAKGRTVYHACNGFGDWYLDEKKGKRRLRTQQNVVACRSLYDDIDVGKEDSYATRNEAAAALKDFIKATGLPTPCVVASGGGIHLYWPMTEDVPPETWLRLAKKKRLVTEHFGLKVDSACDTDSARVLRPVGTTWRKKEARTVECKNKGAITPPGQLEAILDLYIAKHELNATKVDEVPEWMRGEAGNLETQTFPPSSFLEAAKHCNQIRIFAQTGGESEPVWHALAGVAKHCTDGEDLYHQWSSNYDGYDARETQSKIDNWGAGPSTCEKFKALNPEGCQGCTKKCKSPVQLGIDTTVDVPPAIKVEVPPENVAETVNPLTAANAAPAQEKSNPAPFWPAGFSYDAEHETIYTYKINEDGDRVRTNVARPLFYVVDSIRQEDGTSMLVMESVERRKPRRFEIETKHAADPKSLRLQLGAYRVVTMSQNSLQEYVQSQMLDVMKAKDETNTYRQLGWQHDGEAFLIGTKLITKDDVMPVRVGKAINTQLESIGVKNGNKEAWINGVDELYNRPNAEPYQLAICLAFGGILGPFMPSAQWRGIPYAMTSDDTGYGKSTVCKIGLNIYCPAWLTMVEDSTPKGVPVRTSAMGNLPFLLDEVTKYVDDAKDMSDLLYALSNGNTRVGAKSDGTERDRLPGWNVPVMITGNRNIMHHVTEHNLTPAATQARVFEVDLETYPRLATLDKTSPEYQQCGALHKSITDDIINNHYGVIGEEWIRWVIANTATVRTKLQTVSEKMRAVMYGGDASKERFYYDLATMMLVGGYFARKLGYINFDLNNLRKWVVLHVAKLRTVTDENKSTPEDLFANLMADMNGRLLITKRFEGSDRRSATTVEVDQAQVRGAVAGRIVIGDGDERPRVYVSVREITQWCSKNGVQYTKFKRDLMALHLIRLGTPGCNKTSGVVRVSIGKGVAGHEHLGQMRCIEFDAQAIKHAVPAPVVPIKDTAEAVV